MTDPLLTTREAAALIGCTVSHVRRLAAAGRIAAEWSATDVNQYGGRWMFRRTAVLAYARTTFAVGWQRGRPRTS